MTYLLNKINKYNTYRKTTVIALGLMLTVFLGACDLHEPTSFHNKRLTVQENNYAKLYDSQRMSNHTFYSIVENYDRYGDGEMQVTVTYDPQSQNNSSSSAFEHLGAVTAMLRDLGIHEVNGSVLPVNDQHAQSQTLIAYRSYKAVMPDCNQMPGLDDRMPDTSTDYELGCSTETIMAKQIYRPKDLMGNAQLDRSDGRRASNVIDAYRSGEPAEALDAETITE